MILILVLIYLFINNSCKKINNAIPDSEIKLFYRANKKKYVSK